MDVDKCKRCDSEDLVFVKDKEIFNPDTNDYDIMDCWLCNNCQTVHVNNEDFSFFNISIDIKREVKEESDIRKWMN